MKSLARLASSFFAILLVFPCPLSVVRCPCLSINASAVRVELSFYVYSDFGLDSVASVCAFSIFWFPFWLLLPFFFFFVFVPLFALFALAQLLLLLVSLSPAALGHVASCCDNDNNNYNSNSNKNNSSWQLLSV